MADTEKFASDLAHSEDDTEIDIAVAVAWYLHKTRGQPASFRDVCDFIESYGIRHNLNRTRLQTKIGADKRVSAPRGKPIKVKPAIAKGLGTRFVDALGPPTPKILKHFIEPRILAEQSSIIKALAGQLNTSHHFEMYDCTAVMMRRLMECLLIRAFNKSGARNEILNGNDYVGLDALITRATSTGAFHLSRGSGKTMAAVKKIGDKGAHSTTYTIARPDIDAVATDFRALIADLFAV